MMRKRKRNAEKKSCDKPTSKGTKDIIAKALYVCDVRKKSRFFQRR